MITINNATYSGNVLPQRDDGKLSVMLYTVSTIQDLSIALDHATEIIETDFSGTEKTYKVNDILSVSRASDNVYVAEFSTRLTAMQEMSNAIDALLVMVLEE